VATTPEPVVSVVIPARNAAGTLGATLRALAGQDLDDAFEVIVVDNGSSDETASVAKTAPLPVKLIGRPPGDGPGVARNQGVAAAAGPLLAFTDADCVPTEGWLREGLAAAAHADLVQGPVAPDPAQTLMPFDHTVWVEGRTGLFETANLFVARTAFESAGGFRDVTATGSDRPFGEDAWLGWRLELGGARYKFAERALVHHAVFRRGPRAYLSERWRLELFPFLAALIPELRRECFFLRCFLTPRTAAFDLGVGAIACLLVTGSPLAAIGLVPYSASLLRRALGWRRRAPVVAVVSLLADAISLAALVRGSIRARSLVI
jgi:glycosyltransferase involved in cell wall biosynthesis